MTHTDNFSGVCSHRHAFWFDFWLRRLIQNPKKIVGEYVKRDQIIADIGCGPGYFSVEMAKMVGEKGKIYCIDLQPEMLNKAKEKAIKHNVVSRMEFHQSESMRINLNHEIYFDFILVFYALHETGNAKGFLKEMREMLDSNGHILVVEPKFHVVQNTFNAFVEDGKHVGLKIVDYPKNKGGRAVLFNH